MNDSMNTILESTKKQGEKIIGVIIKYRLTVVIMIAAASVMAALVQSGTYLNPPRNEERYSEEKVKINYSSIDEKIVEKLSKTQQDASIEVNENLVPSRNNPFAE